MPSVKPKGLLCFVARHRWVPSEDAHEGVLILECSRCGREQVFSDTLEMEGWLERAGRAEMAEMPWLDPARNDPRIGERRNL
jgi:hypothetical protein